MKNIYANRMNKPPHRLPNSYNGTPHGTPPPRKRRPSLSGADGVTPRERAKQMEEKRREEMRKQRELKQVRWSIIQKRLQSSIIEYRCMNKYGVLIHTTQEYYRKPLKTEQ